jgi:hypothetical protein
MATTPLSSWTPIVDLFTSAWAKASDSGPIALYLAAFISAAACILIRVESPMEMIITTSGGT